MSKKKDDSATREFFVIGHNKKQNQTLKKYCMTLHMAMMYAKACSNAEIFHKNESLGEFENGKLILSHEQTYLLT